MKRLAVKGCSISVKEPNITFMDVTIVTPESPYVYAGGKGAYFGKLTVVVSGIVYQGNYAVPNPVTFEISPSATYVKSHGEFAVLEGDESATVQDITGFNPSQEPATFSMTIYISSAGQYGVDAE